MATLASIETGYVNFNLHRATGDIRPWTAAEVQAHVQTALDALWRDGVGLRMSGDVATASSTNTYTLPVGMMRIRRIDLVDASGQYVDRITNFRVLYDDDAPASFVVLPALAGALTMKVLGYKPLARTGADLPVELEAPVGWFATSLSWGSLAGELLNSKRQQNEDTGRAVSYQDALQNRDYAMGAYRDAISNTPYLMRLEQVATSR